MSAFSLVKDKFGNYVVQKMIEYSDDDKRKEIINKILNSKIIKKKDGYTKHVLIYIEKLGFNVNNIDNNNININNINNSIYNNDINDINNFRNVQNVNIGINNDNDSNISYNNLNINNNLY